MHTAADGLQVECLRRLVYDQELLFFAVTSSVGLHKAYGFLDELSNVFVRDVIPSWALSAQHGGLQGILGETMDNLVTKWTNHTLHDPQVDTMRGQIGAIQGVLSENIDQLIDRGDKIEVLVQRTEQLNSATTQFRRSARSLEQFTWWQNVRWRLMLFSGATILLVFVLLWLYSLVRPLFAL